MYFILKISYKNEKYVYQTENTLKQKMKIHNPYNILILYFDGLKM